MWGVDQRKEKTEKGCEKSLNLNRVDLHIIPKVSWRVVKKPHPCLIAWQAAAAQCCLQGLGEVWDKVSMVTSSHNNHVWPGESSLD